MKRLILEIVILLMFLAAVMALIDYTYKDYKTEADYIYEKFHQRKDNVQTIMIGNSHIGILPEDGLGSGNQAINLSFPNMDFFRAYTILRTTIPKCKNLKYVVLGFDYHELGHNSSMQGENYVDRQFYKYTDTLYSYTTLNVYMARSNFFRSNRDIKFIFDKGTANSSVKNETATFIPLGAPVKINEQFCKARSLEHSKVRFMKSLIPENISLYRKIVALCKANKVTLIIVNPPKTKCYQAAFFPETYLLVKSEMDSLLKNQKYYDFNGSNYFSDADFLDADHLNQTGVKKLLEKVSFTP